MANKSSAEAYLVGDRVREARKSLKLRQADLSSNTGISASHLSDIERGVLVPTIPTLQKIGQALDRPLEYFFTAGEIIPMNAFCINGIIPTDANTKPISTAASNPINSEIINIIFPVTIILGRRTKIFRQRSTIQIRGRK